MLPGFRATQRPWVERLTMANLLLLVVAQSIPALAGVPMALLWLVFAGSQAGTPGRMVRATDLCDTCAVGAVRRLCLAGTGRGAQRPAELGLFAPASALRPHRGCGWRVHDGDDGVSHAAIAAAPSMSPG